MMRIFAKRRDYSTCNIPGEPPSRKLADEGSKTIDAYGDRNQEVPKTVDGIPHPTTFVLDQNGVIRAKLFREGYKERHASAELVEALKKTSRR